MFGTIKNKNDEQTKKPETEVNKEAEVNIDQEIEVTNENEFDTQKGQSYEPHTGEKFNVINVYRKDTKYEKLASAIAEFTICDGSCLHVTKTVDKPNNCYFKDDTITFTITVKNNCNKTITDLIFTDDIDPSVKPITGNEYIVTTTKGIIEDKKDPIKIKDITLIGGETCTVTITGKID